MFERFTRGAKDAVRGALDRAERAGEEVRDEHLFLAVLDARGTRGAAVLGTLGISGDTEAVERALAEARRRGGLSQAEAEALAGLGIDIGAVVSRVEEAHGEGALAGAGAAAEDDGEGLGFLARLRQSAGGKFTQGAKRVLEGSLREALDLGDKSIGDEHILLALTARPGLVTDVLAERGVTHAEVRKALARQAAAG